MIAGIVLTAALAFPSSQTYQVEESANKHEPITATLPKRDRPKLKHKKHHHRHWHRRSYVPAPAPVPAAAPAAPGGAFGACVRQRESGGDPNIMNSSGHYGLYQFSASTWAEYGGNPADFGNASEAEQNQVFANAIAQGGQSNWGPYDGC